jgi:Glyoxalase-like domain
MSEDVPPPSVEIGWVCIDCDDPGPLAAWWQDLIGGELSVDDDGGSVPLLFLRVPEEKQLKNRLHLDLRVEDFEAALNKALSLGAQPRRSASGRHLRRRTVARVP